MLNVKKKFLKSQTEIQNLITQKGSINTNLRGFHFIYTYTKMGLNLWTELKKTAHNVTYIENVSNNKPFIIQH